MSMPSLFQLHTQSETDTDTDTDAVTAGQRVRVNRSNKITGLAFLAWHFRRRRKTRSSYLNTGHLNAHVRRDIGVKRSDLTKPG